jgi:predicted metal-dependent phosphoesterase TrpH
MKLIVKLEAYSDIRDASKCAYIGRKIEYLEGRIDSVDKKSGKIVINKTTVENQANLGDDNDNLSKLRVYYGFEELFSLLRKSKIFNRYLEQGLVFYPTQKFASQEAMEEAMKSAKIIILAEGRKSDPVVKTDIEDYDPVRRLNMYIHVIKFSGEYVVESPCCKPADFVPAADCY